MGHWSRAVAREFVAWVAAPERERWLDVGSGTGALSDVVRESANPASILAVDRSEAYLRHQGSRAGPGRRDRVVADAVALPLREAAVDVTVSALMLNFVGSPLDALRELKRVTRPGGTVAAYVWDYSEGMEALRCFWDAVVEVDPAARPLDEGRRFPLCAPGPLGAVFSEAGYRDVEVRPIEVWAEFPDFAEYWRPFLGGQGPAPGYVATLSAPLRDALRERLRRRVPSRADGSVRLRARAWAVRATP